MYDNAASPNNRFPQLLQRTFLLTLFILLGLATGTTPANAQQGHWLTGYYATYNEGVMSPAQVDYTKLTHVIYWPVIPNTDGTLDETPFGLSQATFNSGATALVSGAHAAGAKALIGIGGNSDSGASAGFSASTTAANLPTFVNNIAALMQLYGFDGVDINWEEIAASSSADNTQFVNFITALRTKLKSISPNALLTMAPATTYSPVGGMTTQQLIASVASQFDQLNIQTYVMSGPFCGWETWYNAPLSNGGLDFILAPGEPLPSANNLIASYASAGIPMSQMAIGVQFDAAVWTGGQGTSTGGVTKPHQTWTNDANNCGNNPAAPSWTTTPYRTMITTLATKAGYTTNFDSAADQSWLSYDPSGTGTTNESKDSFVSYDSPQSIAKKGQDLVAQQATVGTLGGAFIFELSGDYAPTAAAAQQHPLLNAMAAMQSLLPSAVTGLTATPAAGSATLNWSATAGAASYNVYNEASQGAGPGTLAASSATTQATISGLTPGATYWFLVSGVDAFGSGTAAEISVTIPAASNVPTGVTATPSVNQVLLAWNAVPNATSYSVLRASTATGAYGTPRTASTNAYTDTNVVAGKTYYYVITATGPFGTSGQSAQVSATPFGPLAAPTGLSATLAGTSVSLSWSPVVNAASYRVRRSTTSGTGYTTLFTTTNTITTDPGPLKSGTTYYYVVNAVSGTFVSANSNQVSVLPNLPLPTAPASLTAAPGANLVTLTWPAGANASTYNVLRSTTSGAGYAQIGSTAALTYADSTVLGGTTYYYVVQSSNATGTSTTNSPQASAKPTLPAPANLTGSVSGNIVATSWTAVAGATSYQLSRSTTNGAGYVVLGTTTNSSLHDVTATPGTTYYYIVKGYNAANGYSPASNQLTLFVTASKPVAPTGLKAAAGAGGSGVALTWTKTVGAVTYNVLRSTTSGAGFAVIGTSSTASYADNTTTGGTSYYYVVQAVNSAGTSANSTQVSIVAPGNSGPETPTISASVTNGQVIVNTLEVPMATSYGYYRATAAAGPYTLELQADTSQYIDTTVVAGKTYYYELNASDAAGTSAFTAPVMVTIPVVPTGLKATPGNAQVSLTWTAVAGASSYVVLRGASAGNLTTLVGQPSTNSLVDTTVTNGTTYYYAVQTIGADTVSSSAFTAAVSATPTVGTITWVPDFDGQLLQVLEGTGASAKKITISLPSCNPNSVAVNQNLAYVVCSANGENPDQILVYNATTIRAAAAGTLNITPTQTITSEDFNSVIGIAFDASNNLWVASNGNNEVLEFTAASLAGPGPVDTISLINSPSSPVALAFDTDGSMWVTGLFADGILLNFTPDQFGTGENANPRYCATTDNVGAPCITQATGPLFLEPEGVAVFNGSVYVANNSTTGSNGLGGATPGRELVKLTVSGGALTIAGTYGKTLPDAGGVAATSPLVCPGGLFATPTHLWINDESYGEATPQCGANGDSASMTGGVFSYTASQLAAKPTTQAPAFTNVTGRPGFGGIFVENDN